MQLSFLPFRLGPAIAPTPPRPAVVPERTTTPAPSQPKREEPPAALPFENPGTAAPAMPEHDPGKQHETCFGRNWIA